MKIILNANFDGNKTEVSPFNFDVAGLGGITEMVLQPPLTVSDNRSLF